jgi:osmotically-inducible protein OsmY
MNRMIAKHFGTAALAALLLTAVPTFATEPTANDITPALVQAGASQIEGFRAVEIGGIVVLRGRAADQTAASQAATLAQGLGYMRVANLIQIAKPIDDEAIERFAERKLGMTRSLEGCQFQIDSDNGVVKLNGTVQYELQKDVAIELVRGINGVKSVQASLKK